MTIISVCISFLMVSSCLFRSKKPGTGDIAFRLRWSGFADLDLHVRDPFGQHISFAQRESLSGGILNVDCNGRPDKICVDPVENIYWPKGNAHQGKYRYWVNFYQAQKPVDSVDYEVMVILGKRVAERRSGTLSMNSRNAGPFEVYYNKPAKN